MNKLLSSIILCGLVSSSAFADTQRADYGEKPSKQETTGFVSGVALGALAGGPPGAIVGGALGALFGDGWHARQKVGSLQVDLIHSQLALEQLSMETDEVQRRYDLALRELDSIRSQKPQVLNVSHSLDALSSCCDSFYNNAGLSLHFRSGSTVIEQQYTEQLAGMAKIADLLPTSRIEIIGYADRNGDAEMNLNLSKLRTDTVKAFLNRMGIQNTAITSVAYGESQPAHSNQSFESDFFDRRVIVRLRDSSKQMLSQNPELK